MKIYQQQQDMATFGRLVKSFPQGVGEAFGELMKTIHEGNKRAYYGISKTDAEGHVLYWAVAEEKAADEAEKYHCEKFIIPKGIYLSAIVHNWKEKVHCIKDVFHEMMQDDRTDSDKPCIEWYYSEDEMMCFLGLKPEHALFYEIDQAVDALLRLAEPLNPDEFNTIPFEDSWTVAQLLTHVTKSNNGIVQGLDMPGHASQRNPTKRISELKKIFLNFEQKLQSPDFIVPAPGVYNQDQTIAAIKKSNHRMAEKRTQVNLSEVINFAALGEMSKLELLYFVLYHTQRHLHQLKNIIMHLKKPVPVTPVNS